MNRPRNRQPRPPRQTQRCGGPPRSSRGAPATPQQAAGTVPTVRQVVPGASVFIVLKEDQPTGTETAGVVQDILTRGNHPRGIKVRLRGGQIGRVQRMGGGSTAAGTDEQMPSISGGSQRRNTSTRFTRRYSDVRNDGFLEGPPPRSLADFVPDFGEEEEEATGTEAKCPFCDGFKGDEAAVTFHIDKEHLT